MIVDLCSLCAEGHEFEYLGVLLKALFGSTIVFVLVISKDVSYLWQLRLQLGSNVHLGATQMYKTNDYRSHI